MADGPIPGWGEKSPPRAGEPQSPAEGAAQGDPLSSDAPPVAISSMSGDLHDRMLGEFRILRRLGVGGMAEVYLAEQTKLQRKVAVKVLHKDRVADATYVKRFKTEALAAGALSHPNIIQVLMIGEQDSYQYIAQEYVAGMNLRELLARKGPPELVLALRIMRQVAAALHAAHAAGIVHRDIKPENIMITRKGEVKVADFGLAQLTQGGERVNLTQVGVTMGTPLYMSPEQVNGSKVDLRTDIYSLGVTCYHMLSGHPPFRGETALSVAVQHLKHEPEPLETIRGDLPPLLCRIVHKMMAKDPNRRYQSAQALLKDLKRVTADSEEREEQPTTETELVVAQDPPGRQANVALRGLASLWRFPDKPVARQVWAVLILGLLIGAASAGAGWVTRVANPFAAALPRAAGVDKKDKAASQYFYALTLKDSLEAWQAVVDFPAEPKNRLYRDYARQQMARLLLAKRRFDEAQAIFDDFAVDAEPHFRAFGLAGQAILLNLHEEYNQSQRVVDRLQSPAKPAAADSANAAGGDSPRKPLVLFDLLDDKMRQAVTDTIQRNVEKLNKQMSQEWDDIFKKHEPADAVPGAANGTDGQK